MKLDETPINKKFELNKKNKVDFLQWSALFLISFHIGVDFLGLGG